MTGDTPQATLASLFRGCKTSLVTSTLPPRTHYIGKLKETQSGLKEVVAGLVQNHTRLDMDVKLVHTAR